MGSVPSLPGIDPRYQFDYILFIVAGEISRRVETFYILGSGVARGYSFIGTSRKFAGYDKIQNIEVSQSLLERIFGIGNIGFDTAGTDKVEVKFYGIKNPYEIEKIIREKLNK